MIRPIWESSFGKSRIATCQTIAGSTNGCFVDMGALLTLC